MDTPHPYSDEEFIERYFDNELNDEEFRLFENRLESEQAFRKKFEEQKMIRQAAFGMVHKDRKKEDAGDELFIERYFDNDLSEEEFGQFEFRLQSDAVFNKNYIRSLNLRRAVFDLAHPGLQKPQSAATKKADRKIWYALAATVLILLVSGIYLTVGPERVKKAGQLAELKNYEFDREVTGGFERLSDS
ncbi:MAG: hypothetical protein PHP01_09700, partial [Phycisphaerae bacterium]|nr:hypothetical protein [Phycisphaerae bacterium]